MRKFLPFVICLIGIFLVSPQLACSQDERGPSTAEERAQALVAIDDLEANPLGPKAKDERKSLLIFLIKVPDIHVAMCIEVLPKLPKGSKQDSDILAVQPVISSARYAMEHNGGDSKSADQYVAGVLGTLKTYEAMVKAKPEDRQSGMDDLLKKREDGTLVGYVKDQVKKSCSK